MPSSLRSVSYCKFMNPLPCLVVDSSRYWYESSVPLFVSLLWPSLLLETLGSHFAARRASRSFLLSLLASLLDEIPWSKVKVPEVNKNASLSPGPCGPREA